MSGRADALATLFIAASGREGDAAAVAIPLVRALETARAAWPTVVLGDEVFVSDLASRVLPGETAAAALDAFHVSDLYLSCAAARGDARAIDELDARFLARVGQFVARIDPTPSFAAEVTQQLRIKLLVGTDGHGKLAQYSGRGALESWICAAALRTAYDVKRRELRQPVERAADELDVLAASDDPELELLRSQCRDHFRAALQIALAELPARDRALLRLHFLEHLTTARIGKLYRVHETTALRWIAKARSDVLARVRGSLMEKLRLSTAELSQLLWLMQSRLDVTLTRLLDSAAERTS